MKKAILITLLTILTATVALAAGGSSEARKILDKAASKVTLKSGATATFTISGGSYGKQQGTIAIKGSKFCAHTASAILWYDGKTQWLYNKKNQEVNVSHPSPSVQQSMNPYHFLTLYKSGYNMQLTKGAKDYTIHLTGKGKTEMYITITRDYAIRQVKMKQGKGWTTITISSLKPQTLADSAFRFSAKDYPKAEVIDLR